MGQDVEIRKTTTVGDVLVIDTDRSFTGQDGQSIGPEMNGDGVPLLLAGHLFDLGLGIDHLFVLQNVVSVRRPGGWDDDSSEAVTGITHSFLRFYPDEIADADPEGPTAEDTAADTAEDEDSTPEEE